MSARSNLGQSGSLGNPEVYPYLIHNSGILFYLVHLLYSLLVKYAILELSNAHLSAMFHPEVHVVPLAVSPVQFPSNLELSPSLPPDSTIGSGQFSDNQVPDHARQLQF